MSANVYGMTLKEAAATLHLDPATLRVQVGKGKLKAKKLGRDWHVAPSEVARYRKENQRG